MAFRDRGNWSDRDSDLDEGRFEVEQGHSSSRRLDRGYGEDYRGYSRGYNMDREPNYATEYDRGMSGGSRQSYENYGRAPLGTHSWGVSQSNRYETRDSYNQGPSRSHLRCRDIMTRNIITCHSDTTITEIARLMRDEDVGAIPVVGNDGKLAGIVTDRDLVVKGLNGDKNDAEVTAEDCMSTDLYTVNQNDRLVDMIREMGDHQVRRIPVVDGRDRLVGIISMADIATQTNKDMELKEALEEISQPSSWFGRLTNMFSW
ncbi:MAG TPA: CBS domain-containing protein [Blastocatellia bacterium]